MPRWLALLLLALLLAASPAAAARKALFDNAHAETAGNADWQIDTDQPIPLPDQGGIGPATPRTYWTGAISSFGVDMVKRGYTVHTNIGAITYGNTGNTYDLSNYDVFIVPEPNTLFTPAEAAAILAYVHDGGGLVAISDHSGSDRNNDGYDSPMIWNALDPTHLLGVRFGESADANNNIVQTSTNVAPSASDSVTHGPVGVVTGLAFHNGTTMTLYPAVNPTVRGEVWMTSVSQASTTGVMAAAAQYGSGRVFFIGDSSPVDDGSATSGNSSIYDGWGEAGATDSTLFMNAALWASRRAVAGDTQAPVVTLTAPDGGEVWKSGSTHAITWSATDDVGVTSVTLAYSSNGGASFLNPIATGIANSGSYNWTVPVANTTWARVRVIAYDASGNAGRDSSSATFTMNQWQIVASAGSGGTISPSGTTSLSQGASQAYAIAPSTGYRIADVLVDGSTVGAVTGYTFSNVIADHTIAASFALDSYGLTVNTVGSGATAKSPDLAVYPSGTAVRLTATPAAGWAFSGWSGDATGSADTVTVVVSGATSVTATFADAQAPAVQVTAPAGGERWDEGSLQTILWAASDNVGVDSVDVDVSLSGAAGPWLAVAHGLVNSGSYAWTLPGSPSDSAMVRVTAYDHARNAGSATSDSVFRIANPYAGVEGGGVATLALAQPQPNPGRGATWLRFSLPRTGSARLEILDLGGRRVWESAGVFAAGPQACRWDGSTSAGERAGAGLFFVRLVTPWGERGQRLVWLR